MPPSAVFAPPSAENAPGTVPAQNVPPRRINRFTRVPLTSHARTPDATLRDRLRAGKSESACRQAAGRTIEAKLHIAPGGDWPIKTSATALRGSSIEVIQRQ